MNSKEQQLQVQFLNTLRKEQVQVAIFLVSGIRLVGYIESYDQYVILLRSNVMQVVYKHSISTILPARSVTIQSVTIKSLDPEPNPE